MNLDICDCTNRGYVGYLRNLVYQYMTSCKSVKYIKSLNSQTRYKIGIPAFHISLYVWKLHGELGKTRTQLIESWVKLVPS